LQRYGEGNADSLFDVRAVFQQPHHSLDLAAMPTLLLPRKGSYGLTDYEKIFSADPAADIFEMRGIDRARGAAVLVRPDQYVSDVFALGDLAEIAAFYDGFML
jgi:phenol 2-monooxygenase